jgi:hypothetical protein
MSEIEVTKRFKETKDANLRSLQTYVELADEMGLIEGNVKIDLSDEGEVNQRQTEVSIKLSYGPRQFTFPSVSKAVKFLVLLTQTAEKARETLET